MKIIVEFVLILKVLICFASDLIHEEDFNETVLSNDLMYLYKTNGQSVNYLNYKDVYGLRYIPTKKPTKFHPNNEKSTFNVTIPNEVIISNKNDTETSSTTNIEYVESISSTNSESETLVSEEAHRQNFTYAELEPPVDESRNHIMRPNNRVEHALQFLAHRLKKLFYHSADQTRPESKISPQLTSVGKFLTLFNLIRFENVPCMTARRPLRQLSGTCYEEHECLNLGGIAMDRCANGFGVCCVCESFYRF